MPRDRADVYKPVAASRVRNLDRVYDMIASCRLLSLDESRDRDARVLLVWFLRDDRVSKDRAAGPP